MKVFYHDHFVLPLPENHRFPMAKYRMTREMVEKAGIGELLVAKPATDEQLGLAHTADYLHKVKNGLLTKQEVRRIGFPYSAEMVTRSRYSVGSTIAASYAALADGVGVNLAGGTHHAHADWGQGFCVFNDVIVASRVLQTAGLVDRIAVIDCDVHQGNGTASLARDDASIFTMSIHGAKNFPFHKETSDLDVPLPDGTEDAAYLEALKPAVWEILSKAKPDLVIYIAGADPFVEDRLGKLSLSKEGLRLRDKFILEECQALGVPVATVMGGGYARDIGKIASIHFQTVSVIATASCNSGSNPINTR